jgi:hypothetical protein
MLGVCVSGILLNLCEEALEYVYVVACIIGAATTIRFPYNEIGASLQDLSSSQCGVSMLICLGMLSTNSRWLRVGVRMFALCGRYSLEICVLHSFT